MAGSTPRADWTRWFKPLVFVLAALAAGVLLAAPMVSMEPRDLPLAVVDLDEGFTLPSGQSMAAGTQVVQAVQATQADGMLAWRTLESQEALDRALSENQVYAALVVPADFSSSQVLARQGVGEVSPLTLVVNEGKHPMVSSQLSGQLGALTEGIDAPVEVVAHNPIPDALGLSATILPMLFMILVYVASYGGGISIRSAFPLRGHRPHRALIQLAYALVASVVVGLVAAGVLAAFVPDLDFPYSGSALFLAIAAFALMGLVIGSLNWFGIAGMIVPVAVLLLGLGTANLPFEFLPVFWQDWVYPWNPLRFLAEGARALLFQGAGWWNQATPGLVVTGIIGVALIGTSVLRRAPRANAE